VPFGNRCRLVNKAAADDSVAAMNANQNPVVRAIAVIVLIAVGARLVFELVKPVWPYLLTVLIVLAVAKAASWWRGRW
jgi:hypothetical protein